MRRNMRLYVKEKNIFPLFKPGNQLHGQTSRVRRVYEYMYDSSRAVVRKERRSTRVRAQKNRTESPSILAVISIILAVIKSKS